MGKRPDNRVRATYVCHTCQVHLVLGNVLHSTTIVYIVTSTYKV
jgi:hypothetical protein